MPQQLVVNSGGMFGNAPPRRQPLAARPLTRSPRPAAPKPPAKLLRVTPPPRLLSHDEYIAAAVRLADVKRELGVVMKRIDVINTMLQCGLPPGEYRDALTAERNRLSGTRRHELTKWVGLLEKKFADHDLAKSLESRRRYGLA